MKRGSMEHSRGITIESRSLRRTVPLAAVKLEVLEPEGELSRVDVATLKGASMTKASPRLITLMCVVIGSNKRARRAVGTKGDQ